MQKTFATCCRPNKRGEEATDNVSEIFLLKDLFFFCECSFLYADSLTGFIGSVKRTRLKVGILIAIFVEIG